MMKEIGLGENLENGGNFNFNADAENILNHQLLAQMLWYFWKELIFKNASEKRHMILLGFDR